jgi:hypothetical protein
MARPSLQRASRRAASMQGMRLDPARRQARQRAHPLQPRARPCQVRNLILPLV